MAKQSGRPRSPAARQRAVDLRRQQEAAERRRTWMQRIAMVAALAVVGGIVGVGVWLDRRGGGEDAINIQGVQSFGDLSRGHVPAGQKVNYEQTPPVGGDHATTPGWANCGIYTAPIENENAVHSMEHGAVWITYQPDLAKKQIATLTSLVEDTSIGFVLLSPYPDLPDPVVASAWGKQLKLTSADDPRLREFIDGYQRGPQTPELGAACSGGVGAPASTPS